MYRHFTVTQKGKHLQIERTSNWPFFAFSFQINRKSRPFTQHGRAFRLNTDALTAEKHMLTITGYYHAHGRSCSVVEHFSIDNRKAMLRQKSKGRNIFKAGDILISCDNISPFPTSYSGHAALVVDAKTLIEAHYNPPMVAKDSIKPFTDMRPMYAQFRPKAAILGRKAAAYAEQYLQQYQKYLEEDISPSKAAVSESVSLEEDLSFVDCTQLIWLSYATGAKYSFENDHPWQSPQELYEHMQANPDFTLIYQHAEFEFSELT